MMDINGITKEQLLSADFVSELFLEEDVALREQNIIGYSMIAKGFGCKKAFDDLVKVHKRLIRETRKKQEEEKKNNPLQIATNTYTMMLRNEDIVMYSTGVWKVSDSGIISQEGKTFSLAGHSPVVITKILTDRNTGEERLELTWKKQHAIKSLTAMRNVVGSSSKIVELSRYGFPVTTETASNLIKYLSDFEALNQIETRISSSKFGWADKEFIPYTDKVIFDSANGIKSLTESVHEEGSYETWLDLIKQIRASGRKEPVICLAASFGSVLVYPLKILPFIVNMYGTTGSGKTVTLMLASSVWASPNEGGYISESNSTINALEMKLDTLNHLPLMVDDLSKLRSDDRGNLMNLIYGLCSGRGKGRMGRNGELRYAPTWANAIITNMERPLSDDSMRGGALNRILDFEVEPGDIYDDGNYVVNVLSGNFGHAGHAFVQIVNEIGIDKIREIVNKYRKMIRDYAEQTGEKREDKQIVPLAVMMTADLLTEKYIFQDGIRLDLDYCMRSVKSQKQVSEMERAYKHFIDAYYMNQSRFDTGADYDDIGDCWGKRVSQYYVAVLPTALEKIADIHNFNKSQFISWLKATDKLDCETGRNQKMITLRGGQKRCFVIRIDENTEPEGGYIQGEMDLLPDEQLPFDFPR